MSSAECRVKTTVLIIIASAACFVGCRSAVVDPAVRARVLAEGHALYLPTLDYQIRQQLVGKNHKSIMVKLPQSEKPDGYIRSLSILFPGTTFYSDKSNAADVPVVVEILGIRRTGALVGEVFGAITVDGSREIFLYYLKIGRPLPGKPHHWWVVKEDPWPADTSMPIRDY